MNRAAGFAAAFAAGALAASGFFALRAALAPPAPWDFAEAGEAEIREALNRARNALADGRPKDAGDIYRDLALARPFDADAQLLLGIHLQDLSKDPIGAIGRFNDFLRLAPESEKADMVRERIHACELAVAKRFHAADAAAGAPEDGAGTAATEAAEARIRELSDALGAARADAAALREELADVRSERDRLERDNAAKQNQIDALKGRGTSARAPTDDLTKRFDRLSEQAGNLPSVTARPAEQPVRIGSYVTYEVKRGDTLWKIAQKAYNDGSRTAEIKAANPGLVGADGTVREGTILKIPR